MAIWSVSQNKFIDEPQTMGTGSGGDTSYDAEALKQAFLSNPTGKNASNLLTGYNAFKNEPTADEKKKKMQKSDVERILAQVEDAYFNGKNVLSYSTPGNKLSGIQAVASAIINGDNPDITAYMGLRDNLRPTLARAAGDVGNLSGPEQNRAVALIPTPYDTPEEAVKKLNAFRKKIGMAEKDYSKNVSIDKLPLPEQQKYYSGKGVFKETGSTGTTKGGLAVVGKSTEFNPPAQATSKTAPKSGDAFWQRVFNTNQETLPVNIPSLPYGAVGESGGSLLKNPAIAGVIGSTGNWLDQLKNKGIPLTKEAAQRDWGSGARNEVAKSGIKTSGISALLHPIQSLGWLRNMAAANKVGDASSIIQGGQNFVNTARPEQVSMGQKLLANDTAKFGSAGKMSLMDLINEATNRASGAFSKAGDIKSTAAAGYNAATRDAIQSTIRSASPTSATITDIMGSIYKGKNKLRALAKALPWIGSVLYLGDKLKQGPGQ